eukprot:1160806-Pelagomonas_calceolata.AAC.7
MPTVGGKCFVLPPPDRSYKAVSARGQQTCICQGIPDSERWQGFSRKLYMPTSMRTQFWSPINNPPKAVNTYLKPS